MWDLVQLTRLTSGILDSGIGAYRKAVARAIHRKKDTVDTWCRPQATPTADGCHDTGRENPLDLLSAIYRNAEHPGIIREGVADVLDCWLVDRRQAKLLASPATLAEAVEELLLELRRRKPRMSRERFAAHCRDIVDTVHKLMVEHLEDME